MDFATGGIQGIELSEFVNNYDGIIQKKEEIESIMKRYNRKKIAFKLKFYIQKWKYSTKVKNAKE